MYPIVKQNQKFPPSYTVELKNSPGEKGEDVATFTGALAGPRAEEYAAWKYGAGATEGNE